MKSYKVTLWVLREKVIHCNAPDEEAARIIALNHFLNNPEEGELAVDKDPLVEEE